MLGSSEASILQDKIGTIFPSEEKIVPIKFSAKDSTPRSNSWFPIVKASYSNRDKKWAAAAPLNALYQGVPWKVTKAFDAIIKC